MVDGGPAGDTPCSTGTIGEHGTWPAPGLLSRGIQTTAGTRALGDILPRGPGETTARPPNLRDHPPKAQEPRPTERLPDLWFTFCKRRSKQSQRPSPIRSALQPILVDVIPLGDELEDPAHVVDGAVIVMPPGTRTGRRGTGRLRG